MAVDAHAYGLPVSSHPSSSIKALFALSSLVFAFGCATAIAKPERLNDVQSAALLHDVSIETDPPISDATENFFAGGEYRISGRATIVGRYSIRNGRVCVTRPQLNAPPAVRCRMIFRDNVGDLYFTETEPFTAEHSTRFRVAPIDR